MRTLKKNSDGETAEEWLKKYLALGERRATDVFYDAEASGFHIETIKRAKGRVGAGSAQRDKVWWWYITISAPKPKQTKIKVDEFGYSTEKPAVVATVNWMDVIRMVSRLQKQGESDEAIFNKVMEFAYPHAGVPENIVAACLRVHGVYVPNKIVLDNRIEF